MSFASLHFICTCVALAGVMNGIWLRPGWVWAKKRPTKIPRNEIWFYLFIPRFPFTAFPALSLFSLNAICIPRKPLQIVEAGISVATGHDVFDIITVGYRPICDWLSRVELRILTKFKKKKFILHCWLKLVIFNLN